MKYRKAFIFFARLVIRVLESPKRVCAFSKDLISWVTVALNRPFHWPYGNSRIALAVAPQYGL